ncbi:MAG TPA: stimulus-sensing domain-containing protein, partial [Hyphomicrobiaceae bacterium]|nr:stimulus-sensing domain-containing protein [Hyphomicrobiaceae bacterium]
NPNASDPNSILHNPFAELEFSLAPVQITQMLRRLLEGTTNRARVYDLKGNLIHDSDRVLPPGGLESIDKYGQIMDRPNTKNLWTKLTQYLLSSDLRVYKELGDANGTLYPEVRVALKGRTEGLILLTKSGERIVSVASPIVRAGAVQGVLLLSTRPGEIDEAVSEQQFVILGMAILALAAAIIASYLLDRTVAEPMRQLSAVAEDVTHNIRSAADIPQFDDREDEVGQLTRAFKTMTASLYRRIEASEKFAADVAHELKNPLTAAGATAQALEYAKTDEQRAMLVAQIRSELDRLNRLITDVSDASRMEAELALQQHVPVNLAEVANSVVSSFQDLHAGTGKSVRLEFDAAAKASLAYVVSGHSGRLGQILTNLIDNALSFSPADGAVTVRIRRADQNILLMVEDEGPGIDQEAMEKIFDRFYTYRPTANSSRGDNSGLGLSISREIVTAHGGEIWVENLAGPPAAGRPAGGARFTVRLPALDAAPARRGGR